jgi:hypothetical protein
MSFRDDFNTLNLQIWDVHSTFPPEYASVSTSGGFLRFSLNLPEEFPTKIICLKSKQQYDLTGKKLVVTPSFVEERTNVFASVGVIVSNKPIDQAGSLAFRGFGILLDGYGSLEKYGEGQHIADDSVTPAFFVCYEYPPQLKIFMGAERAYLYVGDTPVDVKIIPFDLSAAYLNVVCYASSRFGGSLTALVDYVEFVPEKIQESQPNQVLGSFTTMAVIPPGVFPSILSMLMYTLMGNMVVGLGESVVRKPPVKVGK